MLAHSGRQEGISAEQAFTLGAEALDMKLSLLPVEKIDFKGLNKALGSLVALKPLQKPLLLKACAACITADGKVAALEVELLRAIAATIDCPMPPLVSED